MLSGGLDTSIVASVVSILLGESARLSFKAYTVALRGAPSPDLEYSKLVSERYMIPRVVKEVEFHELERYLPEVISVLKSFDPMEVRNSVVAYIGMKEAKAEGFSKVMMGDASDELFAGYSFVFKQDKEKARESLLHLWEVMHFSSIPLAKSLGMEARLPYLQPEVMDVATKIDFDYLIGTKDGSGEIFGKYILRRAFEDVLPSEVSWRTKTPIEQGSGTSVLPVWYSKGIEDSVFSEKRRKYLEEEKVRLRDKEQLRYYEIYRAIHGPPVPADASRRTCPACTSNVPDSATFCTTCGEYPI